MKTADGCRMLNFQTGFMLVLANQALCAILDTPLINVKVNTSCECGELADDVSSRIVGGTETSPHLYPWMAAILSLGRLHCGGSVINDRYVLTAGHCISGATEDDVAVFLGAHDLREAPAERIVAVDRLILHESYASDYAHDSDDIGLIRLKERLGFDAAVAPVCLSRPDKDYTGRTCEVVGWGLTAHDGETSPHLRRAAVTVLDQGLCRDNDAVGGHLRDTVMCAYTPGADACQGDSGGPLLYEARPGKVEQIGIVSWGIGCAEQGVPGVYTKVSAYLNWIKINTADAIYCEKRFL
ncbi:trypsin-1-like [Bacillus rossius redtenbacheri]|uniref:trypsin-1-like n=1 Tax=Bacillus rossius redtenbacheri TaxID=93214 RepID=UPI002FDE8DB6